MHVVTGASSGIGRGVALALAARGERVVAVGRDETRLRSLASNGGSDLVTVSTDLATTSGRAVLLDAIDGPVTSLVHGAASTIPVQGWTEVDPVELTGHFHVHVAVPVAVTAALLARGPVGRVVFIDSFAATTPRVGWSAYAIMKAAAQMSARAAAAELHATLVARVFPGAVETPLLRAVLGASPDIPAVAFYRGIEAAGRVSDPIDVGDEIARIILDVSDEELAATEEWSVGHSA